MSKKIKKFLLASDLDGTLINKDFKIPENNLKSINNFMNDGGFFSISTGRSIESSRRYAQQINPNAPCVVLNGVVIYDFRSDKILWDTSLQIKAKDYLKDIKQKFPKLGMEIFAGNRLYLITANTQTDKHVLNEALEYIPSEIDDLNGKWYKALFAGSANEIDEIEEYVKKSNFEGVSFVRSTNEYFEMLPCGINKGTTIEKLAEILNVPIENTAAIGDYYNDIEMIKVVGTSFAAGNAPERVKQEADFTVCDCNQGAIYEAIAHLYRS